MPLSRIEIEQIGPGRWVAEVEAGGSSAVRRHVAAPSFDEMVLAVVEAHAELTAPPAVKAPVPLVRELEAAQSERIQREVDAQAEAERAVYEPTPLLVPHGAQVVDVSREDLLAEAANLGVDVDRRWGDTRLRVEIERAKAGAPAD